MAAENDPAVDQEEIWRVLMRMADPSDLLKTILNAASENTARMRILEFHPFKDQLIIFSGCTVTVNQQPQHPSAATASTSE